ncbi:MAG: sigma-70 family RNA polymerase sigma factor [Rubripirellula sp.]
MNAANPSPTPRDDASDALSLQGVWQTFGDQLRRRARTRLRQYGLTGQAESMDICNDVMADLIRSQNLKPSNEPGLTHEEVLSYIMRAIDNQVIDTFRMLARQCRDFRRNESVPPEDMAIASAATTPSQIAIRREVFDRIREVLDDADAPAVDLMLENRDWNEIGQSLGIKPDTARMRIRRALDKVRREMGLPDGDPS